MLVRWMSLCHLYLCVLPLHKQPSSSRDRVAITVWRDLGQCETPAISSEPRVTPWRRTGEDSSPPHACVSGCLPLCTEML